MLTVIPFRAGGKSRLPEEIRREVALAMLGDVVEVALAIGEVRVVTDDAAGRLVAGDLGARLVDDPGGGQGAAVGAGARGRRRGSASSSTPTCPASGRRT